MEHLPQISQNKNEILNDEKLLEKETGISISVLKKIGENPKLKKAFLTLAILSGIGLTQTEAQTTENIKKNDYAYSSGENTQKLEKGIDMMKIKKTTSNNLKFKWTPSSPQKMNKQAQLSYKKVCPDHPHPVNIISANNSGMTETGDHGYGSGVRENKRLHKRAEELGTDVVTILKIDNMKNSHTKNIQEEGRQLEEKLKQNLLLTKMQKE